MQQEWGRMRWDENQVSAAHLGSRLRWRARGGRVVRGRAGEVAGEVAGAGNAGEAGES